jgi:hypothetical protein
LIAKDELLSRRLNLYGFSMARMRLLFGSRDHQAIEKLQNELRQRPGMQPQAVEEVRPVFEVVERAILTGIPFRELDVETYVHSAAVMALAQYEQDWLITDASSYNASALEDGLWRYRKLASDEAKAFLRGLIEGLPLFGQHASADGSVYAIIGIDRLPIFIPHLRDLAETLEYRVGKRRAATDEDHAAVAFASELCEWIEQIISENRDLLFMVG